MEATKEIIRNSDIFDLESGSDFKNSITEAMMYV